MRKLITLALAVTMLSMGVGSNVFAQTGANLRGTVTGEAVDAGGRATPGQRVELVQSGQVVQTTVTGSNGHFMFTNVAAGDYIVRVLVNGQPAGVRVSLASGAAVANALIVTPSAAAPSAGGGGGGGLFTNPWIFAALIATAIAVPVAIIATGS